MKTDFEQLEPLTREEIHAHKSELNGNPSIYVGTYHKYNCGSLYGIWIDLLSFDDYDDFYDFCKRLHRDEEDPEFMVQDFECFPKSWYHESGLPDEDEFERIREYGNLDSDDKEMFDAYMDCFGDENATFDDARDKFMGYYNSDEDFAYQMAEDTCMLENVPENIKCYFDYKAFARDLMMDYYKSNGYYFQSY